MAIRKREPSAAGAYNAPNSGASNMAEAGAIDGLLPANEMAAAIKRLPGPTK